MKKSADDKLSKLVKVEEINELIQQVESGNVEDHPVGTGPFIKCFLNTGCQNCLNLIIQSYLWTLFTLYKCCRWSICISLYKPTEYQGYQGDNNAYTTFIQSLYNV